MTMASSSTETASSFDQARADAFQGQMLGVLNGGMLALMCSIGRQTGLFDIMDGMGPATSQQVANASELDERYVREWLSAMACGQILDYDAEAASFELPAEHAGMLTRSAGPFALTHYCQFVAQLGEVEGDLIEAFRNGGGVGYDRYPRFQQIMAETSGARFDLGLIDQMVPLIPEGTQRLTAGADLADVGCGKGLAVRLLAAEFPASSFTGYDFSEEGIDHANAETTALGLTNASFEQRDAAKLDLDECFDIVTSFDAVHDQAHPDDMLAGIYRALRPGGSYLCVEPYASSDLQDNLANPMSPSMYSISTMHCMTVSLAYGGEGLGAQWGEQLLRDRLTQAGFEGIESTQLEFDRTNAYYIAHKPG
jgi:SAM-dependent methyltransferase